ncbi:fimbrial protein [Ewingella americana]|uniref:Major pilin n=2 Tax=Ewingella americana TaxID=41202 RepID=A0A377NE88_9GAMM|nr:fimbrial protein [Ewingella americana]KAA8729439.1 type 1 fimbrial protein [Ewingella americana]KFC83247.1 putative fimbrial protein [Ewingella americana ATCC 33852]STQ45098.1 Major pilin [Ewingella americana]
MKKILLATTIIASFCAVNAASAASTGTITFNGELTATTCDVVVGGQAADATVTLPTIAISQLTKAGQTAGRTNFPMALTNCAGTLKTASAYFEDGSSVDATTGRLNNLTGNATGVQLQLLDGQGSRGVIKVGDSSQTDNNSYVDVSTGTANLNYDVEYYATAATTAGTVVSNVVYSIQYK